MMKRLVIAKGSHSWQQLYFFMWVASLAIQNKWTLNVMWKCWEWQVYNSYLFISTNHSFGFLNLLLLSQVEGQNGEVGHEVLGVTSQTELDRKKGGLTLPLSQVKFPAAEIETPQEAPEDLSGNTCIHYVHNRAGGFVIKITGIFWCIYDPQTIHFQNKMKKKNPTLKNS